MSFAKPAILLAPLVLLSGCISFGPETPDSLLTLTSTATAPTGSALSGDAASAIVLNEFETTAALDVTRVPVQITDTRIAYLQNATWVERPARLFRRLIGEALRVRSDRFIVDGDDPGVLAEARLDGTLRQFGYDARIASVVLVFDGVMPGPGSTVRTRRFEAVIPGIAPEAEAIGPALNKAANQVALEVAEWVS